MQVGNCPKAISSNYTVAFLDFNQAFSIHFLRCRFSTIDELKSFALSLEGVDDAEPVSLQSSDGSSIVSIYTLPAKALVIFLGLTKLSNPLQFPRPQKYVFAHKVAKFILNNYNLSQFSFILVFLPW